MAIVEELMGKTVFELKSYAKKNNIDLFGVSTKAEILEVILNFIPKETDELVVEHQKPEEKIAVYSVRNLTWNGVGELKTGYNIVTQKDSEKWLTHKAVRAATPEEVKRAYGK